MTSEPTVRKNVGNAESISFAQSGSFIARIHLYGRREERKGGRREGGKEGRREGGRREGGEESYFVMV